MIVGIGPILSLTCSGIKLGCQSFHGSRCEIMHWWCNMSGCNNVGLEFSSSDDAMYRKMHKHKVGIRLFKDNQGMSFISYPSRIWRFNCSNKESSWITLAVQSLNSRIPTLCLTVWRCCHMDCLTFYTLQHCCDKLAPNLHLNFFTVKH